MNPKDVKERGLATGDVARVFNDRGEILTGVLVTDIVPSNKEQGRRCHADCAF